VTCTATEKRSRDRYSNASLQPRMECNEITGYPLGQLGEEGGILSEFWRRVGHQQLTRHEPSAADEGVVISQVPAPGTPIDAVSEWTVVVSDGGPGIPVSGLPSDVVSFALSLPGVASDTLVVRKATRSGDAYKSEDWLFSLSCNAVHDAYRTFVDASYRTACPGFVEGLPPNR
jgi:hypothetical protein